MNLILKIRILKHGDGVGGEGYSRYGGQLMEIHPAENKISSLESS